MTPVRDLEETVPVSPQSIFISIMISIALVQFMLLFESLDRCSGFQADHTPITVNLEGLLLPS